MYKEVCDYAKTCEHCQRMSFFSKYLFRLNVYFTPLFGDFWTDFAGSLPATTREMRLLVVCLEHVVGWSLAYSTSSATSSEVTAFIMQHFNYTCGRSGLIVPDNSP